MAWTSADWVAIIGAVFVGLGTLVGGVGAIVKLWVESKNHRGRIDELLTVQAALKLQLDGMAAANRDLRGKIEAVKAANTLLDTDGRNLTTRINALVAEQTELRRSVAEVTSANSDLKTALEAATTQIAALIKERDELVLRVKALEEQIKTLVEQKAAPPPTEPTP